MAPQPERSDVLIVGGGVIGMAIAESLATEGLTVRVLEAEGVGSGASGAAAGMLAPLSELAGSLDSPLSSLGVKSLQSFASLCARLRDETGIDPEFEASGVLHVATGEAELTALVNLHRETAARVDEDAKVSAAADFEWVEATELRDYAAGLDASALGGLFSPHEAHLRPPLLVRALEIAGRERGVHIDTGVRVHGLLKEGDRVVGVDSSAGTIHAGTTLVSAGAFTPALLRSVSDWSGRIAIEPVRGQILSLEAPLPSMKTICWAGEAYLVPKRDGSWVVGATQERVGFDRRVTAEGVAWLLERARSLFPILAEASFGRAWAGLRPVSEDGLPWIGAVPDCDGLFVAAGHGRNGVLLSPITAKLVTDALLGKALGAEGRAVSPARGR